MTGRKNPGGEVGKRDEGGISEVSAGPGGGGLAIARSQMQNTGG